MRQYSPQMPSAAFQARQLNPHSPATQQLRLILVLAGSLLALLATACQSTPEPTTPKAPLVKKDKPKRAAPPGPLMQWEVVNLDRHVLAAVDHPNTRKAIELAGQDYNELRTGLLSIRDFIPSYVRITAQQDTVDALSAVGRAWLYYSLMQGAPQTETPAAQEQALQQKSAIATALATDLAKLNVPELDLQVTFSASGVSQMAMNLMASAVEGDPRLVESGPDVLRLRFLGDKNGDAEMLSDQLSLEGEMSQMLTNRLGELAGELSLTRDGDTLKLRVGDLTEMAKPRTITRDTRTTSEDAVALIQGDHRPLKAAWLEWTALFQQWSDSPLLSDELRQTLSSVPELSDTLKELPDIYLSHHQVNEEAYLTATTVVGGRSYRPLAPALEEPLDLRGAVASHVDRTATLTGHLKEAFKFYASDGILGGMEEELAELGSTGQAPLFKAFSQLADAVKAETDGAAFEPISGVVVDWGPSPLAVPASVPRTETQRRLRALDDVVPGVLVFAKIKDADAAQGNMSRLLTRLLAVLHQGLAAAKEEQAPATVPALAPLRIADGVTAMAEAESPVSGEMGVEEYLLKRLVRPHSFMHNGWAILSTSIPLSQAWLEKAQSSPARTFDSDLVWLAKFDVTALAELAPLLEQLTLQPLAGDHELLKELTQSEDSPLKQLGLGIRVLATLLSEVKWSVRVSEQEGAVVHADLKWAPQAN